MSACLYVCMSARLHVCMSACCMSATGLHVRAHVCMSAVCMPHACHGGLTFDTCQQLHIYVWHMCIHAVALWVKLSSRTSCFHLFFASCRGPGSARGGGSRERVQTLPVPLCWVGGCMEVEQGQANNGNGLSGVLGMSRAEFRYLDGECGWWCSSCSTC